MALFPAAAVSASEDQNEENGTTQGRSQRHRKSTLQDLIAIYLPHMALCALVVIAISFINDPTMKLLLYSALPLNCRNWLSFGLCFLEDMRLVIICAGMLLSTWQFQVIAFQTVSNVLEDIKMTLLRP